MQEKVRNLEREVEWVRGEREEEVSAMAHEKKETASRLKELEAASNRLKSARKDDLKRVSKERSQAFDRCKVSLASAKLPSVAFLLDESGAQPTAGSESMRGYIGEAG